MKFGQVYEEPPGSGKWFAKFPNGRRIKSGRASYTVRRVSSEAKGWAFLREVRKAQLAGLAVDGGPTRAQGALSVAQAVHAYIDAKAAEGRAEGTLEQYRISLKAVRESGLGAIAVGRATPDDVRRFLAWRRTHTWRTGRGKDGKPTARLVEDGKVSNAVLYRDRGLLAATYNWLVEEGRATSNPVRKVKPPRKRQTTLRPFEPDEIAPFVAACHPDYLRPLVFAGLYLGQGGEELIRMRWRGVSFGRHTVAFVRKKTGRAVAVPLHPHLATELKALKRRRAQAGGIPAAEDHVFLSRLGRPYAAFPKGAWAAAIERAGLKGRGLKPHSLRRTFATYYEGQDVDLKEILGHADLATTLIYRRSRDERKRAAVEGLNYGLGEGPHMFDTCDAETGG